jgi:single-strand DNA-binding protein
MLNRVILIGRLAQDPELRYTTNGTAVCSFTVAVNRNYTTAGGERAADFIDCVAWRQLAENLANYMSKGRLIAVEGSLQVRSYETKDGQKRRATEVVADNVRFLDKAQGQGQGQGQGSSQGQSAPPPRGKAKPQGDEWSDLGTEIDGGGFDIIEHGKDDFPF